MLDILTIIFWLTWAIATALALSFGAVLLFGAPYLPTLKKTQEDALDLLDLKNGQTVVDLGCGDGRFLRAAASRGLNAVGYELNPFLAFTAWLITRAYRKQVKVTWGSFWRADISAADGVYVFLIERHMKRLDGFLSKQKKPRRLKVVSHAFKIPGRKPTTQKDALFLYQYQPVRVAHLL
ncbi:MAG: hypothetical protein WD877_02995 [Candidatus Saccharimonadales bacterium]